MSQDSNQDQSHVIGEMFDVANISQPIPFQDISESVTPENVEVSATQSKLPSANNGFTTDNLQPPTPASESAQEDSNE
jgi:hypothetical protein